MRTGSITVQQTLTSEAASVLKHSLSLARRRGHAQVTPLHVAATLLSPKTSLLKRACFKSQPQISSHPLQCRALELCFNVALNRLPTATPTPLLHGQPSFSNALIAALKRAQAHQRRGCIEQQTQQPLLAIKVELEQLILSILDDPSVSRVMREAGFSSTAVKNNIEENSSSSSPSSVFQCYSTNGGVYSSPPSPPDHTHKEIFNPNRSSAAFWQNPFWNQKYEQNPFLFSPQKRVPLADSEEIKLIFEVFLKKRKKNTVIVGDSLSVTEGLVLEVMDKIEKGDIPEELKSTHFIKFQFSSVPLRFMKREEVEVNVSDLKRKVDSFVTAGKGVIIYTGDLKWTVDERESGFGYNPVDHLVADIGKLISDYGSMNTKVWLMGTANYQTYMRCQMKQPSLEVQWCLQAVSVPSGGLGLSLHATGAQDSKITFSHNPCQVVLETKPFSSKEEQDKLTCCDECTSKYEKEAAFIKCGQNNKPSLFGSPCENKDMDKTSKHLPYWLQSHTTEMQKDDLVELRRKWNRFCHSKHQGRPSQNNASSLLFNKSHTHASPYPWWPNQNTSLSDSNSISFAHSNSKPNHIPSSLARFRRQQSCHIEFSFSNGNHKDRALEPNLDSLKNTEGKEVKITLALGNSQFSEGGKSLERENEIHRELKENVPWQVDTISSILEALVGESKSGKKGNWLLIEGNDFIGKRRLALGIAESIFGSADLFVHMNMRGNGNKMDLACETLEKVLRDHENLVVLVENIDYAHTQFLKVLSDAFEDGKFGEISTKERKSGQVIFILTKGDSASYGEGKDLNSVVQMKLEVSEINSNSEKKRKTEWDFPNKAKSPRIGEKKNAISTENMHTKKEIIRQSSSNTLDLNIKAEDEDAENENKSADMNDPHNLLDLIKNRFYFNQDSTQDSLIKDMILSKIKGSFEEVCKNGGHMGCLFGVENKLLEEFLLCAGCFLNSQFEKWVKEVFETSLKTVIIGGKEGSRSVRVCLGKKGENELESSGFMGSCLPKKIQVSYMG